MGEIEGRYMRGSSCKEVGQWEVGPWEVGQWEVGQWEVGRRSHWPCPSLNPKPDPNPALNPNPNPNLQGALPLSRAATRCGDRRVRLVRVWS